MEFFDEHVDCRVGFDDVEYDSGQLGPRQDETTRRLTRTDDDDDGLRHFFFVQFGSKSNGENTIAPAMWKVDCRLIVDACANCAIVREENRKR